MNRSELQTILFEEISKVMEIPLTEVKETSSSDTVSTWDSMTQMSLILALEEGLKIRLSHVRSTEFSSVKSIMMVLEAQMKPK